MTPSLTPDGAISLLQTADYDAMDWVQLRLWCHHNARYGLPTLELIDWLHSQIGNRKAIEIGAGSGDLCYHLDVPGFDNHQQEWPEVKAIYDLARQPTIRYGGWVERMDALDAVRGYKPEIVIGSWITHWVDPALPVPNGVGNMYGVKEDELLRLVDTYIMIGNLAIHEHKPILKLPHEEYQLPFVKSRASRPELDRVFVWRNA